MLHPKRLRVIEVFHVVTLLAFAFRVPFCFWDMRLPAAGTAVASPEHMACMAGPESDAVAHFTSSDGEYITADGSTVLVAGHENSGAAVKGDVQKHPEGRTGSHKGTSCEHSSPAPLTMMPFLFALISGGVFSLEAFEAFPML
mmetsp:Transcript_98900/g.196116  ORF Transcript_98900/g.196116 Transcript_98900/m.196116 type:complete len:143 (+) Transcript_98900:82-510(+)